MTTRRDAQDEASRRACERLVLDSAAHNDAADWDALGALYTDDAVLVRPSGQTLTGRSAIVDSYAAAPAGRLTRHVCTNIRIDLTGPDTAAGHTLVLLFIADPPDDAEPGNRTSPGPAVGEFVDRFRLTSDGWRIAHREASVIIRSRPI